MRPQVDTTKVSVDAAMFENESAFGFGIIARDHEVLLLKPVQ